MKKIKKLISRFSEKVTKTKTWLSNKTIIPERDKIIHYMYSRYPAIVITIFGAASDPKWGLIGLLTLCLIAVLWELPQLIKGKFSKPVVYEALADLKMTFLATFSGIVVMIIILTKYM